MPQVANKCDTFGLEPYKCAEDRLFHPITCAQDELNLLSSLNTLGYIEFDILCILNYLKEKLKFDSSLPSFNHCSLHAMSCKVFLVFPICNRVRPKKGSIACCGHAA